jgi:SAM-dependent methyltransferase
VVTADNVDAAKAEAFAGKVMSVLNGGMISIMTAIGHQVGLFDTMAATGQASSAQIAHAAGLNERYVREWLATMVTGGFVDYDPGRQTYTLPPEHAMFLTRAAGPNNLAVVTQFTPLLARVTDDIAACFRNGGGLPYSAYTGFHELMAEDSANVHDALLLNSIIPVVPGIIQKLSDGAEVLDVGCGSGHAMNLLAAAYPASRFAGYDVSQEAIARARSEAAAKGLGNVRFEVKDVATIDDAGRYDLITAFDAIHDQADPAAVLANIARALKPDGAFLMVDIAASSNLEDNVDHPIAPSLYAISTLHCMSVSLAQGGAGLGTMWGEQLARKMLSEAGLSNVTVTRIEGDIANNYFVATK